MKNEDPYLGLLAYRTTGLHSGVSPAELSIGRKLRTTLPALPALLFSKLPNHLTFQRKEDLHKGQQKHSFDRAHRAVVLKPLNEGDKVLMDKGKEAVVENQPCTRSYLVRSEEGLYRRNRRHVPDTWLQRSTHRG